MCERERKTERKREIQTEREIGRERKKVIRLKTRWRLK